MEINAQSNTTSIDGPITSGTREVDSLTVDTAGGITGGDTFAASTGAMTHSGGITGGDQEFNGYETSLDASDVFAKTKLRAISARFPHFAPRVSAGKFLRSPESSATNLNPAGTSAAAFPPLPSAL